MFLVQIIVHMVISFRKIPQDHCKTQFIVIITRLCILIREREREIEPIAYFPFTIWSPSHTSLGYE